MKKTIVKILSVLLTMAFVFTSLGFISVIVSSIKLNTKSINMQVGKTYSLRVTITPNNATNKKLIYTSGNKNIATVDQNGKVKGIKEGKTTITVTSSSNKKALAKCSVTVKPKGLLRITMLNRVNTGLDLSSNNPVTKMIEKLANVKLEVEAPPINNFFDRQKLVIASGDLPDVVYNNPGSDYEAWSKAGLLIPIDDKIVNYPNIMKNVDKAMLETARSVSTGKIHAIPRPSINAVWGIIIRQDWLDKLGLKAPSTLDEFKTVCDAFVKRDPDGNGKADTYGFTTDNVNGGIMGMAFIMDAFDLVSKTEIPDTDGQFKILQKKKGYIPYLTFLREAYSNKWLENEFFLNKNYDNRQKLVQKRVGMYNLHDVETGNVAVVDPEAVKTVSFYPPLVNSNNQRFNYMYPATWGHFSITSKCRNVDDVLKFIDWAHGPEGGVLLALGIKGIHYTNYDLETKVLERTEAQSKLKDTVLSTYCQFTLQYQGEAFIPPIPSLPGMFEKYFREKNAYMKVTKDVNLSRIVSIKMTDWQKNSPDVTKKLGEYETKYVVGEISLTEFKKFLDNEYFPSIAAAEKEITELAKAKYGSK